MKKENYYKFMWTVSALLILTFAIRLFIDYRKYDPIANSAPFDTYILVRAIEFLLPSLLAFILGKLFKKKYNK